MDLVSAKRVFAGAWSLFAGQSSTDMSVEDFRIGREALRWHLRRAWRYADWPELRRHEQVALRAEYEAGTTYAEGDEVYDGTYGYYYRSLLGSNKGHTPMSSSTWWEQITGEDFDNTLPADADWCGPFGDVLRVTLEDPRKVRNPVDFEWEETEEGLIVFQVDSGKVWIRHRRPVEAVEGEVLVAGTTYTTGQAVYFEGTLAEYEGDFWRAVTSTAQTPQSYPAGWNRIEIPARFEGYLTRAVAAAALRADGQTDKAREFQAEADDALAEEAGIVSAQQGPGEVIRVGTR